MDLINLDLFGGRALEGHVEVTELWDRLCELGSFNRKQSPVKSGRWFSWHQSCAESLHEFFSTRMLLEYRYPSDKPDAGVKSFSQLRGDMGGLRLALTCCGWSTWFGVQVLRLTGQPCWNHYTETVEGVKSPSQGLTRQIDMSTDAKWMRCKELTGLVEILWAQSEFDMLLQYHVLSRRHLASDEAHAQVLETFVKQLWFHTLSVLSKRSSALSKLGAPPECFAACLQAEGAAADRAEQSLMEDWRLLCLAEQSNLAQDLATDIQCTVSAPMRLVFLCFECGKARHGRELLASLLRTMPDTKFIEDLHQKVKTDSLANANRKQNAMQIQNVLINSGMFESRGIPHTARLDKTIFKRRWKKTKMPKPGVIFNSRVEKLPSFYSKIMGVKTWPSLSEDALGRSAAAWQWLRVFSSKSLKQHQIQLNDSQFDLVLFP